jgi:hypothetical protein
MLKCHQDALDPDFNDTSPALPPTYMPSALALPLGTPRANAAPPAKGTITLAEVKATVWGEYAITPMLFPGKDWRFHLVVVPKDVRQGTFVKMAQEFSAKQPHTRARFFSDTAHLKQCAGRDRFMNGCGTLGLRRGHSLGTPDV